MEKLRNSEKMLIDIYAEDVSKLDIVASIYRDFNKVNAKSHKMIMRSDNPMLIYTALMYDKNSPIRKEPIDERKKIAIQNANFATETAISRAIGITEPRELAIIHYYLKYQNSRRWASFVALEQNWWVNNQKLLSGGDDVKEQETVNKLAKANNDLMGQLDKLEEEIFGDNDEKKDQIINFCLEDFVDALYEANAV